ncbi:hypothetical protein ACH4E7_22335 [Kitasatospora sp. NPDC018058]|uniref:hypothetical protein n=1 Tax=Kitasatospora sp. NPDC018058 TaxID=3364025 RepID=UPI0037C03721
MRCRKDRAARHLPRGADGGTGFRGALFLSTASPQLERLNTVVGAFEYETDAGGKSTGKSYEWK